MLNPNSIKFNDNETVITNIEPTIESEFSNFSITVLDESEILSPETNSSSKQLSCENFSEEAILKFQNRNKDSYKRFQITKETNKSKTNFHDLMNKTNKINNYKEMLILKGNPESKKYHSQHLEISKPACFTSKIINSLKLPQNVINLNELPKEDYADQ